MKTVLITGGAGGIGAALCTGFAREGCAVAVHYHTKKEKAEQLAACLAETYGVKTAAVQADVSRSEDVKRLFDEADSALGSLDILVNNAGISMRAMFKDLDLGVIRSLMDVNFWGTVQCTKYALPYLLESRGSAQAV